MAVMFAHTERVRGAGIREERQRQRQRQEKRIFSPSLAFGRRVACDPDSYSRSPSHTHTHTHPEPTHTHMRRHVLLFRCPAVRMQGDTRSERRERLVMPSTGLLTRRPPDHQPLFSPSYSYTTAGRRHETHRQSVREKDISSSSHMQTNTAHDCSRRESAAEPALLSRDMRSGIERTSGRTTRAHQTMCSSTGCVSRLSRRVHRSSSSLSSYVCLSVTYLCVHLDRDTHCQPVSHEARDRLFALKSGKKCAPRHRHHEDDEEDRTRGANGKDMRGNPAQNMSERHASHGANESRSRQ